MKKHKITPILLNKKSTLKITKLQSRLYHTSSPHACSQWYNFFITILLKTDSNTVCKYRTTLKKKLTQKLITRSFITSRSFETVYVHTYIHTIFIIYYSFNTYYSRYSLFRYSLFKKQISVFPFYTVVM